MGRYADKLLEAMILKRSSVRFSGAVSPNDIAADFEIAKKSLNPNFARSISYGISQRKGFLMTETTVTFTYGKTMKMSEEDYRHFGNPRPRPSPNEDHRSDDRPLPPPQDGIKQIVDSGQSSFRKEIDLSRAAGYDILTRFPNKVADIIRKEMSLIVRDNEGINSMEGKATPRGSGQYAFELRFPIGMPYSQFLDHRVKGEKAATTALKRLTHGAKLPPEIVCLLAYAMLQNEVTYDTDYANRISPGNFNCDMHMAYGPLMLKRAVCEGYAWALIHIMRCYGLKAELVCGKRGGGGHAWAKVEIDHMWYNVDPTIVHHGSGCVIRNFLVSDASLMRAGYDFETQGSSCLDTRYEDFTRVEQLLQNKEEYIRKGADKALLSGPFQK